MKDMLRVRGINKNTHAFTLTPGIKSYLKGLLLVYTELSIVAMRLRALWLL